MVRIDGVKITSANKGTFYDPDGIITYAPGVVNTLKNTDVVTITKDAVKVTVGNYATGDDPLTFTIGDERTLELTGNGGQQKIAVTSAKDVVLKGSGSIFEIDGTNTVKPIKLTTGVQIINEDDVPAEVTVLANNTATINGVVVSSSGDLTLTVTSAEETCDLKINPADDNTININNTSGKAMTITFNGDAKMGDKTVGQITVESNAAVTVTTGPDMGVEGNLDISTTDGSIDIDDQRLLGKKNVTITSTGKAESDITITADTIKTSPINLEGIQIRSYTLNQLKALRDGSDQDNKIEGSDLTKSMLTSLDTDEKLNELIAYFNAFGSKITTCGAKVSNVIADETAVTITIPKEAKLTLAEIEGLD